MHCKDEGIESINTEGFQAKNIMIVRGIFRLTFYRQIIISLLR